MTAGKRAMRESREWVLLPVPRQIAFSEGTREIPRRLDMVWEGVCGSSADQLKASIETALKTMLGDERKSGTPKRSCTVTFRIEPGAVSRTQGYQLDITMDGVCALAHDEAGLFYAAMTLKQLARQASQTGALPCVHIEDYPDFTNRGVMLDIARSKVPEMETLYALVDKLATWKYNQLQLYTEHVFAYRNHHTVWEGVSPMTPAQMRSLDAYCKSRCIELVPNQQSFGHMEQWVSREPYKHLAEIPDADPPCTDLCPVDPASVEFLAGLYADLLPNFTNCQINVGCDEVWSLGKGRSIQAVEERGFARVYLEFLLKIRELVKAHGRTMQFWDDVVMQHPELMHDLPKDAVALEWGYMADHPFPEHCKRLAEAGVPFYVAPGTSSWTLTGRTDNAIGNLRNAAENGLKNGAIGYLVTDWGDFMHWTFLPVSYLGFAYGAAVSWCFDQNKDIDIARALDVHAFEDSAGVTGRLVYDLGLAHSKTGVNIPHHTAFLPLLQMGDATLSTEEGKNMTVERLHETLDYIDKVMARLPEAKMASPDAGLIVKEYQMSAALARLACHIGIARLQADGLGISQLPVDVRYALAAELEPLVPEFRQLWLARNRSGGLKQSAGRMDTLLVTLQE